MPKAVIDPINLWFQTGEQLGEYLGIRFGRVVAEDSEPEWIFIPHTDYDGIGGFAKILRDRGAELPKLPQIRHPSRASRIALARALPKYLFPRRRVRWGPLERGRAARRASQPPHAVAWHVFDESATTQIRRVCRKSGISVNSFLLRNFTKAVRPFLEDQSSVVPWMVPVNLRGKVTRDRDTANHTSYVSVKVKSYETVYDIHRNIYAALGKGEHWANWYAYHYSRFLPARVRRYLVVTERAMSQWHLGAFSNLGDWDADRNIPEEDCEGPWLFCPPVLRCQLIGAGCVTFQNRLSLTVQAHSDLTTSPVAPRAWVHNWVREIEIDVASAFAEMANVPWLNP